MLDRIDAYLESHLNESIAELSRLVAQPSVGAQNWGIQECAALVADLLRRRGFDVQIMPTAGAPIVCAERKGRNPKTLLFYNHYDVQPPEPLELWETPPFEPSLREGKLYGRGVSDDKGHLTARLFAIDALLATLGDLPCTVKFIIEGEEETSSLHLPEFVRQNLDLLEADACIGGEPDVGSASTAFEQPEASFAQGRVSIRVYLGRRQCARGMVGIVVVVGLR